MLYPLDCGSMRLQIGFTYHFDQNFLYQFCIERQCCLWVTVIFPGVIYEYTGLPNPPTFSGRRCLRALNSNRLAHEEKLNSMTRCSRKSSNNRNHSKEDLMHISYHYRNPLLFMSDCRKRRRNLCQSKLKT